MNIRLILFSLLFITLNINIYSQLSRHYHKEEVNEVYVFDSLHWYLERTEEREWINVVCMGLKKKKNWYFRHRESNQRGECERR